MQLRVIDHSNRAGAVPERERERSIAVQSEDGGSRSSSPGAPLNSLSLDRDRRSTGAGPSSPSQSFLQNPYYFMFASLAKPDEDVELHWLKVSLASGYAMVCARKQAHIRRETCGGARIYGLNSDRHTTQEAAKRYDVMGDATKPRLTPQSPA